MTNTCTYRIGGNNDAAKAAYMEWMESGEMNSLVHREELTNSWDDLNPVEQERWRAIFRAGHRAYRNFILENG
jgi:hypothetical protein